MIRLIYQPKLMYHIKNNALGEPPRPILEHHFFDNLIQVYKQLTELGFTYYNGKVAIIDFGEEKLDLQKII